MKVTSKSTFSILMMAADKFPPFRVDLVHLFSEELASRGHRIDWLLQSEEECRSPYEKTWGDGTAFVGATRNGECVKDRVVKHLLGFLHDLTVFRRLKRKNYDFLQLRDKYVAALPALLAAKVFGCRFVLWMSFPFPEAWISYARDGSARYPRFYFIRGKIQKFVLYNLVAPASKHIFVQSPEMKRMFVAQGVEQGKLTVVPMGYSSAQISDASKIQQGAAPDQLPWSVVYIGSLARNRRIDFVLRTFRQVLDKAPQAMLYLIGAGDDKRDDEIIAAECSKLNLQGSVVLTGFIPQEEAFNYVRKAAVCISPIYPDPILNAGSPTKLVEYMAFGKAVVANDQLEQKQILQESGGGLCVPWQEQAYANAILELLKDPEKADRMGAAGKQYIEKHRNYARIASDVESVYLSLCSD